MKGYGAILLIALMIVLTAIKHTESKKMTIEEARKTVKNLRKVCSKKTDAPKELLDGQHKEEYVPRVDHIVDVCQPQVTATDGCEVAWQFAKCMFETDSEIYMAP